MNHFDRFQQTQGSITNLTQFAGVLWIATILFAIASAIWIYKDAESRKKSGIAAALLVFFSVFHGVTFTAMVLCSWILLRPTEQTQNQGSKRFGNLHHDDNGPSPSDFLGGLENDERADS